MQAPVALKSEDNFHSILCLSIPSRSVPLFPGACGHGHGKAERNRGKHHREKRVSYRSHHSPTSFRKLDLL